MKKVFFILILFTFLSLGFNALADNSDDWVEGLREQSLLGKGGILDNIAINLLKIFIFGAVICFVIAAFHFLTAEGDPEKFRTARRMVLYGIIGLLVAFSAWGIINLIKIIFIPIPEGETRPRAPASAPAPAPVIEPEYREGEIRPRVPTPIEPEYREGEIRPRVPTPIEPETP